MESLTDKKLARSIGVSNFSAQLLMDLLRYARVRPSTLQIEHHPYLTQTRLVDYAQKQGIAITAYSSFGPLSFLELNLKDAHGTPPLFEHDVVKAAAEKHSRTPAQVLLRWATQRKIAVIPKSNSPTRLAQNLQVNDFDLDASEVEAISALDKGLRFNDPVAVSTILSCVDTLMLIVFTIVRHGHPYLLRDFLYLLGFYKPRCYFLCYVTIKNRIMNLFNDPAYVCRLCKPEFQGIRQFLFFSKPLSRMLALMFTQGFTQVGT